MEAKDQILDKALHLFMRYGIKSVSMDDLAREMGMSKKTLYQHVEDKKDLVEKSFRRHIKQDEDACCAIMNDTDNAIQQLLDLAKHLVSTFSEMNPGTIFDIQKYYPTSWKIFTEHKNEFVLKQVQDNLKRGVESGLYRGEMDIEIVSRMYITLVDASVNPDVFSDIDAHQIQIFVQVFDYHLHAVMSDEGRTYFNQNRETLFTP